MIYDNIHTVVFLLLRMIHNQFCCYVLYYIFSYFNKFIRKQEKNEKYNIMY